MYSVDIEYFVRDRSGDDWVDENTRVVKDTLTEAITEAKNAFHDSKTISVIVKSQTSNEILFSKERGIKCLM